VRHITSLATLGQETGIGALYAKFFRGYGTVFSLISLEFHSD
jgi:hypothetical protein